MKTNSSIYQDIAERTGGDIYIGIVGPVRTGKSTFIKRFMETLVIPNIEDIYRRERAKDELPQSGSGKTIMTAEPKFVPEDAVEVTLESGEQFSVRLIDCVGYMVRGAMGQFEGEQERMVTTPWFPHEVSMTEAAERGTNRVITEHSTIGLVITTDGTVCDIPREDYIEAETRVISELKAIGKPFIILLNSADPQSESAQALREELTERHGVSCVCTSCLTLSESDIIEILRSILGEFPMTELGFYLPSWVNALPMEHPLRQSIFQTVRESASGLQKISGVTPVLKQIETCENIEAATLRTLNMGSGIAEGELRLPSALYYETISAESGFTIRNDGDLMALLTQMADIKAEYDRVHSALEEVKQKGYGVVMPAPEDLHLESPEIVRSNGKYSVRLKASAPSIHMIAANIETEVTPALGSGDQTNEEILGFLLQGYEGDVSRIWESNIFGKSLYDIASEGLAAKIHGMPEDAQSKLQETLQRIVNEGSGGLICIIL